MNPFQEIYQNLSDNEILKVLVESHKYNEEAIEAAKEEFSIRGLNDHDLELVKTELSLKATQSNILFQKNKRSSNSVFENEEGILPIKNVNNSIHNQVIVITIISLLLSLSTWFNNWYLLNMSWNIGWKDIYLVEPFINMFVIPIACFLFYKKQLYGWVLLVFIYLRAFLQAIFYVAFLFESEEQLFALLTLGYSMLYGVIIWFLLHQKMKNAYGINKKTSNLTITISVLIGFILLIIMNLQSH